MDIYPKILTSISKGSCTVSGTSETELIRFYEGTKFITESYLLTPITLLSNVGISARSNQKVVSIKVVDL